MEALSVISDTILGIVTLFISIYLLSNEIRKNKVLSYDLVVKSYDSMNALGLSNDKNLEAIAEVLYPDKKNNLDVLRQRLFSYTALNAIELTFLSKRYRIIRRSLADPILEDLLESVLQNPEAQDIIKKGTYDKRFTALAKTKIEKINSNNT